LSDDDTPGKDKQKKSHPRFAWGRAVRESDLPPIAKFVALLYAEHLRPNGRCRITNDTITREMGYRSEDQPKKGKALLIADGWLVVVEQGGGRGRATVVEARIPVKKRVADRPKSEHEPVAGAAATSTPNLVGIPFETGRDLAGNRSAHRPPAEGEQKVEQTTTVDELVPDGEVVVLDGHDEAKTAVALIGAGLGIEEPAPQWVVDLAEERLARQRTGGDEWSAQRLAEVVVNMGPLDYPGWHDAVRYRLANGQPRRRNVGTGGRGITWAADSSEFAHLPDRMENW
jgi:hypothetical protein